MGTSLRELEPSLYPIAKAFVGALTRAGLKVRINSVRRDMAEQERLYANFRRCGCSSCPPKAGRCYPVAKPGSSPHALGIAWDMSVEPRAALPIVGAFWERLGFRWGGNFSHPDPIHFDFHPTGWTP